MDDAKRDGSNGYLAKGRNCDVRPIGWHGRMDGRSANKKEKLKRLTFLSLSFLFFFSSLGVLFRSGAPCTGRWKESRSVSGCNLASPQGSKARSQTDKHVLWRMFR